MRFRSLRALTLMFLVVFISMTVATAFALYNSTNATIDRLVRQRIAFVSEAVAPDGEPADAAHLKARIQAMVGKREYGGFGFVLSQRGTVLFDNAKPVRPLVGGYDRLSSSDGIAGLSFGWALTRPLPGGIRLSVIAETEPVKNYRKVRFRLYLLGFGSTIAIVTAASVIFGLTIRRRMLAMQQTVDAIIAGDMARRVPTDHSGSEFDRQAESFNRMLDRMDCLMKEIGNVSSGIAHELRTPLARMRNQLKILLDDTTDPRTREGIEAALEDADAVLATFSSLLRLSEIESGERRRNFSTTDLADIAARCVLNFAPVAEDMAKVLEFVPSIPAPVRGDKQLLAQLVINLIENALRHTPPGTRIEVCVSHDGSDALLTVTDNGPGLPEALREKAIARFGRLHNSTAAGHGIGLSLCDSIARLHHGKLWLEDADPGLRAVARMPLAPRSPLPSQPAG